MAFACHRGFESHLIRCGVDCVRAFLFRVCDCPVGTAFLEQSTLATSSRLLTGRAERPWRFDSSLFLHGGWTWQWVPARIRNPVTLYGGEFEPHTLL